MPLQPNTSTVLSVRIDAEERTLLEVAAGRARTSLSDFVRRTALVAAEMELLERADVVLSEEQWEAFEAWARLPAVVSPGLAELAALKPTWER